MASAGCEFICENMNCEHYKKGITLISAWPLGDIDLIIEAPNVKKIKEFRDGLIQRREQGRKYACITYPNLADIPKIGYRVNMWCDKCFRIWEYDVLIDEKIVTPEDAVSKGNIPENCPECKEKLKTFVEVIDDNVGIYCPSCKQKMLQSVWFSNEINTEILK